MRYRPVFFMPLEPLFFVFFFFRKSARKSGLPQPDCKATHDCRAVLRFALRRDPGKMEDAKANGIATGGGTAGAVATVSGADV